MRFFIFLVISFFLVAIYSIVTGQNCGYIFPIKIFGGILLIVFLLWLINSLKTGKLQIGGEWSSGSPILRDKNPEAFWILWSIHFIGWGFFVYALIVGSLE